MNRSELVRRLVLSRICDDYENVDQVILEEVAEDGVKCALTIERPEVVDALAGLIADGLAKAYRLSTTAPALEIQGMPAMDDVEVDFKTYFYATKKGIALQLSDDWWPFDDDGNLLPNWHLDLA